MTGWRRAARAGVGVIEVRGPVNIADLRAEASRLDRQFLHLDGSSVTSKAELIEGLIAACGLPEWTGDNWDGLEESLADLDSSIVVWTAASSLTDPRAAATAREVLSAASAAASHNGHVVSFIVVAADQA